MIAHIAYVSKVISSQECISQEYPRDRHTLTIFKEFSFESFGLFGFFSVSKHKNVGVLYRQYMWLAGQYVCIRIIKAVKFVLGKFVLREFF